MTTPTFKTTGRPASFEARRLARPLPRVVAERLGEKAAEHEALAQRLGETRSKATALRAALPEVEADDRRKAEAAISAGKAIPKARLAGVEQELAAAEREVEVVTGLIAPSARKLLAEALPVGVRPWDGGLGSWIRGLESAKEKGSPD